MAFIDRTVINDPIGSRNIVLIGDAMTRSVRAYERRGLTFSQSDGLDKVAGPDGLWTITESALIGVRLARVPGHISYWFAWDGYLGLDSDLYEGGKN